MQSRGREVPVGTTRGKDVYLDHTPPSLGPAGQHQGHPSPRPVTSLFSWVPRVRTQPGGSPEQCHPPPWSQTCSGPASRACGSREGHGARSPQTHHMWFSNRHGYLIDRLR